MASSVKQEEQTRIRPTSAFISPHSHCLKAQLTSSKLSAAIHKTPTLQGPFHLALCKTGRSSLSLLKAYERSILIPYPHFETCSMPRKFFWVNLARISKDLNTGCRAVQKIILLLPMTWKQSSLQTHHPQKCFLSVSWHILCQHMAAFLIIHGWTLVLKQNLTVNPTNSVCKKILVMGCWVFISFCRANQT